MGELGKVIAGLVLLAVIVLLVKLLRKVIDIALIAFLVVLVFSVLSSKSVSISSVYENLPAITNQIDDIRDNIVAQNIGK